MALEKSTPYRNAWYRDLLEKEAELKQYTDEKVAQAIELPEVTSEDNGDLLAADDGSWVKSDKLKYIMNAGVEQAGKIPMVDGTGKWSLTDYPSNELPSVTSADNGKIAGVVNGNWDIMDIPNQLKSIQFVNGQVLTDDDYASIKANTNVRGIYSDASKYIIFGLSSCNFMQTEFEFVNYKEGLKVNIDTNKLVTITQIPIASSPTPIGSTSNNAVLSAEGETT